MARQRTLVYVDENIIYCKGVQTRLPELRHLNTAAHPPTPTIHVARSIPIPDAGQPARPTRPLDAGWTAQPDQASLQGSLPQRQPDIGISTRYRGDSCHRWPEDDWTRCDCDDLHSRMPYQAHTCVGPQGI